MPKDNEQSRGCLQAPTPTPSACGWERNGACEQWPFVSRRVSHSERDAGQVARQTCRHRERCHQCRLSGAWSLFRLAAVRSDGGFHRHIAHARHLSRHIRRVRASVWKRWRDGRTHSGRPKSIRCAPTKSRLTIRAISNKRRSHPSIRRASHSADAVCSAFIRNAPKHSERISESTSAAHDSSIAWCCFLAAPLQCKKQERAAGAAEGMTTHHPRMGTARPKACSRR